MIPDKVRAELVGEPEICARRNEGDCKGRITWEHCFLYANKKIQERWAIIFLCERHHGVGAYSDCRFQNKRKHQELALKRATKAEINKYPRLLWKWKKYNKV